MTTECKFGSINVETGEFQEGYIQDGQMKYKKQPWYKRLFQERPEKTEFLTTTEIWTQWPFCNKNYHTVAVYKKFNPYTNKIYRIYSNFEYGLDFSVDAFEHTGKLIPLDF